MNLHYQQCRRFTRLIRTKDQSIYKNIALENTLFEQTAHSVEDKTILLWKSDPCVVIGKFQNPWKECNVAYIRSSNIHLARRLSGGGAVYHDPGNVCVSFMTHRDSYNRKQNLLMICDVLNSAFPGLTLAPNQRDDIILDNKYKVSGTAAKLIKKKAYHHLTLLVNSNRASLSKSLKSPVRDMISTTATESLPAPVMNLSDRIPGLKADDVMDVICDHVEKHSTNCQVRTISGTEPELSDLSPSISDLRSWDWTFGKTPPFSLSHGSATVSVKHGHIESISLDGREMDLSKFGRISLEKEAVTKLLANMKLNSDDGENHLVELFKMFFMEYELLNIME